MVISILDENVAASSRVFPSFNNSAVLSMTSAGVADIKNEGKRRTNRYSSFMSVN